MQFNILRIMPKIVLLSIIASNLVLNIQATGRQNNICPENTVFVFDIHDVITTISPKRAWNAFCKLKNKNNFFRKVFKYKFKNKPKKSIESIMLENQFNQDNEAIIELINPHCLITETCNILKRLKALGYQIYICSNIGEKSFEYMRNKYPQIFSLITACHTSNASNEYITKSNPLAFKKTIELINIHSNFDPKNIIFVDDTNDNLKIAKKVDERVRPICFENPNQLRKALQNLGITV